MYVFAFVCLGIINANDHDNNDKPYSTVQYSTVL